MPPGKAVALARFAGAARAQAVARLPDDRRAATLVAFIRTLEASASDDVIDLFDVVSTRMFSNARINARDARMRSLRDLDAASLRLRDAGVVLLDDSISDAQVRAAVFALVDRTALTDAVAQVNLLAERRELFCRVAPAGRDDALSAEDAGSARSCSRARRTAAARRGRPLAKGSQGREAPWTGTNIVRPQGVGAPVEE